MIFLRTMWSIFWAALRHPFCNTVIDCETGEILFHYWIDPQTHELKKIRP